MIFDTVLLIILFISKKVINKKNGNRRYYNIVHIYIQIYNIATKNVSKII